MKKEEIKSLNWIQAEEVMAMLKISRTTLHRWTHDGVIPGYKLPTTHVVYYDPAEIEEFIRKNLITPSGRLDKVGYMAL